MDYWQMFLKVGPVIRGIKMFETKANHKLECMNSNVRVCTTEWITVFFSMCKFIQIILLLPISCYWLLVFQQFSEDRSVRNGFCSLFQNFWCWGDFFFQGLTGARITRTVVPRAMMVCVGLIYGYYYLRYTSKVRQ